MARAIVRDDKYCAGYVGNTPPAAGAISGGVVATVGASDRQKLEGCLAGTRMVLEAKNALDLKVISAFIKRQIGPGWTVVTAAQWLTGKVAWGAIQQMGAESVAGGCSKVEAMMPTRSRQATSSTKSMLHRLTSR
jgi:hypothetical protein